MGELLGFFDVLMNIPGSKTYEAVLENPDTIEWMAAQKDSGSRKVPLFGHTEIVSLLKTLIDVTAGQETMSRPKIPGHELRTQRKIKKTNNSVAQAQERARKRDERLLAAQSSKGI
jgi:hypothetical protein